MADGRMSRQGLVESAGLVLTETREQNISGTDSYTRLHVLPTILALR